MTKGNVPTLYEWCGGAGRIEALFKRFYEHIRILLDCTNPVTNWPEVEIGTEFSGGERVARWAAGASVVKIFNTTGYLNMANPQYGSEAVTMFYAGDDASAKRAAEQLAADLGFDPLDVGPLSNSKYLEMLEGFWGTLAFG
jgi:8-hydroxy-5-deazaflavin:NADPH oxidoreductase